MLTLKQRKFVKDYLDTGNGTEAVMKNYKTKNENTAGVIAYENLRKPKIIKAISERLDDDLLVKKHYQLLNKIDQTGEIDVQAVSKGLDMAYKIKGSYVAEKVTNTINVEELRITIQNNLASFRTNTTGERILSQSTETIQD